MPPKYSASQRSQGQREQLLAARARRLEEGGIGPSEPAPDKQLEAVESALHYAQLALSNARAELQGEREHSASLYNVLRITKRKLQRTQTAKIQALEQAMEAMELVEKTKKENIQLTEEKDELEDRISELLQDVQLAEEKHMEIRKKV